MNFINIFQNYKIFNKLNVDSMSFLGEKSTYDAGKYILYKGVFSCFFIWKDGREIMQNYINITWGRNLRLQVG